MNKEYDYLTPEWLKDHASMAHYFGLGFIQVKLDDISRVHFYHPDLPAFVEEPHDHRYDFISDVVCGSLHTKIWRPLVGKSHIMSYEDCRQGSIEAKPVWAYPDI